MIPRIFNFLLGIIFPDKIFLHKNGRRNPESPLDSSLLGKFLTKTYGFSLRTLTNFRNFEGTSPWHVFFGKLWTTLANFSRVFSKIIQWIFQRSHSIPYFKDKHIRRTIFYQIWYRYIVSSKSIRIISQKQPKQPISLVFASHRRLASAFAATAAPRAGTWLVMINFGLGSICELTTLASYACQILYMYIYI